MESTFSKIISTADQLATQPTASLLTVWLSPTWLVPVRPRARTIISCAAVEVALTSLSRVWASQAVESVALAIILLPDVHNRSEKNKKMGWGRGVGIWKCEHENLECMYLWYLILMTVYLDWCSWVRSWWEAGFPRASQLLSYDGIIDSKC